LKKDEAPAPLTLKAPDKSWIKRAFFTLEKKGNAVDLTINVETLVPKEKEYSLSYIYWKNSAKVEETSKDKLSLAAYKKGDMVYADVMLSVDGQMLEKTRSELIQIPNSSPSITAVNIPNVTGAGPGIYTITVKAEDIDGDKITYSLLPEIEGKSLPGGLKIDPGTGVITLDVGEKGPPARMTFIVAADDGDDGICKKVVSISFKVTKEKEKEKEKTETEVEEEKPLIPVV